MKNSTKVLLSISILAVLAIVEKPDEVAPPRPAIGEAVSQKYFEYIDRVVAFDCNNEVKALVKYDIRAPGLVWGTRSGRDTFLRFRQWSKRVAPDGTIRLVGDDAEAQNGFGGWARVNYSCTVDIATNSVKDASLNPGRILD